MFNRKLEGQGLIEYALIIVLVAIVIVIVVALLGPAVMDAIANSPFAPSEDSSLVIRRLIS